MTPKSLPALGLPTETLPADVTGRRPQRPLRAVRRRAGWLLLSGWVVLPLLPVLGLALSALAGVSLF